MYYVYFRKSTNFLRAVACCFSTLAICFSIDNNFFNCFSSALLRSLFICRFTLSSIAYCSSSDNSTSLYSRLSITAFSRAMFSRSLCRCMASSRRFSCARIFFRRAYSAALQAALYCRWRRISEITPHINGMAHIIRTIQPMQLPAYTAGYKVDGKPRSITVVVRSDT